MCLKRVSHADHNLCAVSAVGSAVSPKLMSVSWETNAFQGKRGAIFLGCPD